MTEHLPILIVVLPLAGALIIPLAGIARENAARIVTFFILGLSLACSVATLGTVIESGPIRYALGGWAPPWGIEYYLDPLSSMMAVLICFFALLSFVHGIPLSGGNPKGHNVSFLSLFLLLTAGLNGMVVTGDVFNFYVFLEISSLAAYALLSADGDRGVVAVFRYLLLGTIGASLYLLGIGFLYGITGTLNAIDLTQKLAELPDQGASLVGILLVVTGLCIKIALLPLHAWLPDTYTYSPPRVTGFVAAVMSKVGAYALFRFLFFIFRGQDPAAIIAEFLGFAGAAAILGGAAMAIAQRDVRRMLAYSSVSQMGYVVVGFSIGNEDGVVGSLLHIFNHALMKGCLFFLIAGIFWKTGIRRIEDFAGLGKRMPWSMGVFAVAAFSMIGIPPTAGFFSKWYLLSGAFQAGLWPLGVVILLGSLLGAVYFFRILESAYFRTAHETLPSSEVRPVMLFPVLLLALLILVLGIENRILVENLFRNVLGGWGI